VAQAEAALSRAEAARTSGAVLQAMQQQQQQQQQQHDGRHDSETRQLELAELAAATTVQRAWRRAKAQRVNALFARVQRFDRPGGEGMTDTVHPGRRPADQRAPIPAAQHANARVVASLSTFGSRRPQASLLAHAGRRK